MDLNQRIEKLIEAGEASYGKSSAENLKIEQRPGKRYIKLVCSHYDKRTGERAHVLSGVLLTKKVVLFTNQHHSKHRLNTSVIH